VFNLIVNKTYKYVYFLLMEYKVLLSFLLSVYTLLMFVAISWWIYIVLVMSNTSCGLGVLEISSVQSVDML